MIDDSIVRGTTIAHIVTMLKECGATEVHVRISAPPFLHPCFYGTDVPSGDRLIAVQHTIDEIRQWGGSDDAARERILAAVAERREWLQEAGLGVDLSAAASKDGAQT